ncbi:ATP-binding protein [Haloarcula argentinensis]|uniref:ATP-binding protein n=1 Tax=Haloarcula argentinensis TaxID=43776 RepID=UPI00166824C7|nr:ATP-binding protein [Haloarcula argentinensis]
MSQNFLLSNPENRIKKQIENIYESYSNPWDILAELNQNAVDAIKEWENENEDIDKDHLIELKIERSSNSIEIYDTGIGILPDNLPELLAPNATDKAGDFSTIGEKGVGLTYCIFCSNKFQIETTSPEGYYEAEINGARTWRERDQVDGVPGTENQNTDSTENKPLETGTKIRLDDVQLAESDEESIFELSPARIEYLLRTKTAIGNTKARFAENQPNIDIELTIVDEDGEAFTDDVSYEYYYPDQFWKESEVVDLEEFESRDDIGRMSDEQKRRHLDGKVWKAEGITERNGKNIRYYALFVPSSKAWDRISEQNDLIDQDGNADLEAGVYTSTRGMPTGIEIGTPDTGSGGYWANTYILLGYDGFNFDLGRKSIPGRTQGMLKEIAADKFRTFSNWRDIVNVSNKTPARKPEQVVRNQRGDRFQKLKRIKDLNCPGIQFQKVPDGQEAGVVSIFHELIGSGYLDNYRGYRTGYSQDYDFWGVYDAAIAELGESLQSQFPDQDSISQEVVIEAKYDAADVITDIESGRKYLEDIDLVVSWTINEERFETASTTIEPLADEDTFYVGSTHEVVPADPTGPAGTQLYLMCLKRHIRDQIQ